MVEKNGKGIIHIGPGNVLDQPDPINIKGQQVAELVRPEQGGSQFEYRTLSSGAWKTTFVNIGSQMFDLNTWHLAPAVRDTLRQRAGW